MQLQLDDIQVIYFDLDNTLVDHSGAEKRALQDVLREYPDEFPKTTFKEFAAKYKLINDRMWRELAAGEMTAEELKTHRFIELMGLSPKTDAPDSAFEIGEWYLERYAKHWRLFDGAQHAITAAAELTPTGLMSNGFRLQVLGKIKRFAWESTFDYVVISEEVGIMKPHRGIFDYARQLAGVAKPRHILYVGDHYESDILGASKAGWKTIWLNHYGVYKPDSAADVEVGSMTELAELFESYQRE